MRFISALFGLIGSLHPGPVWWEFWIDRLVVLAGLAQVPSTSGCALIPSHKELMEWFWCELDVSCQPSPKTMWPSLAQFDCFVTND